MIKLFVNQQLQVFGYEATDLDLFHSFFFFYTNGSMHAKQIASLLAVTFLNK